MKLNRFLVAATAALAIAACNGGNQQQQQQASTSGESGPVTDVAKPASGNWSEAVTKTHEGGFMMGNPNAEVKLVEFGSMTCPACARFDEQGMPKLIDQYVKDGRVSFEFRNYVRDPYDITAALIARCNGERSFFPLTRALFDDQEQWMTKLQNVPPEQQQALATMSPDQQFVTIAKWAGLQQWAAMRGVPTSKSTQCLTDQAEIERLVQMNSDAVSEHGVSGTPTFLVNGEKAETGADWDALESKLQEALGS